MAFISTEDAKAYLRVSGTREDGLIAGLVGAVARHFETVYGLVLGEQERSWTFDCFARLMFIPVAPITVDSLSISYIDPAGTTQVLAGFRTVASGHHVRLMPEVGQAWPATAYGDAMVTVTGQAGWADGQVPADVVVAGKLMLARWYDNRDAEPPAGVAALLDGYRLLRV